MGLVLAEANRLDNSEEYEMADEHPPGFGDNLLRMIAAQLQFANAMNAAREMFGRSYFSLGAPEKAAVDQAVLAATAGNYQVITPEFLTGHHQSNPVGFHVHMPGPS